MAAQGVTFAAWHRSDRNFFLGFVLVAWLGVLLGFVPASLGRMAGKADYVAPPGAGLAADGAGDRGAPARAPDSAAPAQGPPPRVPVRPLRASTCTTSWKPSLGIARTE